MLFRGGVRRIWLCKLDVYDLLAPGLSVECVDDLGLEVRPRAQAFRHLNCTWGGTEVGALGSDEEVRQGLLESVARGQG
jgi:hypothetical protein